MRSISRSYPTDNITDFEAQLASNIRAEIKRMRKDGTCGASITCLRQCVPSPSSSLNGAPRGTNAQYYYAQIFENIACLVAGGFVRGSDGAE